MPAESCSGCCSPSESTERVTGLLDQHVAPGFAVSYCPRCAHPLAERLVDGDEHPRLVCDACGFVFYLNPRLVAGTLPVMEDRIVLLRRGIEPRRGFWTFPGGFVELGESVEEAAHRETLEETSLDVRVGELLNVYTRVRVGVVSVVYLAEIVGGQARTGPEALEVRWFSLRDLPWEELAFPTTGWALRDWQRWMDAQARL